VGSAFARTFDTTNHSLLDGATLSSMSASLRLCMCGALLLVGFASSSCASEGETAPAVPKARKAPDAPVIPKKPLAAETLPSCPGVEAAINVINQEKLLIHWSDGKEFIVTSTVGAGAAGAEAVVHIAAIDRATGAKREIAALTIELEQDAPILVTPQTIFVTESGGGGVYRISRAGGPGGVAAPPVGLLSSSQATLSDGEYIYGIDQRAGFIRRFRVKISDFETMTTETAAESPLIDLAGPDPFIPYLATKSALYLRASTAPVPGQTTDVSVAHQPAWIGPRTTVSKLPITFAAINDDAIFFIDGSNNLTQKFHGSTIPLTAVRSELVSPNKIFADQNHVYFSTPDTLARVTMSGEATRVVNAIGAWAHQDVSCIYATGYTALAK
jgi:hypothetical protein